MAKRQLVPLPLKSRDFRSTEEIDAAIAKLRRRIDELEKLDVQAAVLNESGEDKVVTSNIRTAILEVFGPNSPELKEHGHIQIWAGPVFMNMGDHT